MKGRPTSRAQRRKRCGSPCPSRSPPEHITLLTSWSVSSCFFMLARGASRSTPDMANRGISNWQSYKQTGYTATPTPAKDSPRHQCRIMTRQGSTSPTPVHPPSRNPENGKARFAPRRARAASVSRAVSPKSDRAHTHVATPAHTSSPRKSPMRGRRAPLRRHRTAHLTQEPPSHHTWDAISTTPSLSLPWRSHHSTTSRAGRTTRSGSEDVTKQ